MKNGVLDILSFTAGRTVTSLVLVVCLVTLVFAMAHLAPGDPVTAMLSPTVPRSVASAVREQFGLDQSLPKQYLLWIGNCLHGELGTSISHQRPVSKLIGSFLPNTALLACAAVVIEFLAGVLLGMIAARYQKKWIDRVISQASLLLYTVPTFWIGVVLVAVFSYTLGLLPSSQMFSIDAENLLAGDRVMDLGRHLLLPALTIAIPGGAAVARYLRANLIQLQNEEYILYARSFGVSKWRMFFSYELPNAAGPIITLFGLEVGTLLTGALVTETIYAWPGMGRLAVMAIISRDYPLIMGCTIVAGVVVIAGNFMTDLIYMLIDPRVRARR
jgi:peptide/nickel transport system permease protein